MRGVAVFDPREWDLFRPPRRDGDVSRRSLPNMSRYAARAALLTTLAACGTTEHFVERPQLTIDVDQQDARHALAQLFAPDASYAVKLCEADPKTRQCKKDSESISATGLGGLILPLVLHLNGMRISRERPSIDGLAIDVAFESTADGIPPICATGEGVVVARDDNTASVHVGSFYCNWMLVGNVFVNVDMSMDSISLQEKAFTGYYKLVFHGTGNVSGSGYYRAEVTPTKAT
jgi:hypothetical protein